MVWIMDVTWSRDMNILFLVLQREIRVFYRRLEIETETENETEPETGIEI